ncbi:MAG: type II toxin-antitoxin system RelE/ParE family toxin [Promethearchaeia archaeon]
MVKIEWSSRAEDDLNEIFDYIAQDSIEVAYSFYEKIKKRTKDLARFPKM